MTNETLVGTRVILRRYELTDLDAVMEAIASSHEQLRGWMPWAQQMPTKQSVQAFLEPAARDFGGEHSANYAITMPDSGAYVGGCSLMHRVGPRALEIGYWVDTRSTGRGVAPEAAQLLAAEAFEHSETDRVEIHCDEANAPSASVARRAGFTLDRIDMKPLEAPSETGRSMIWVMTRP